MKKYTIHITFETDRELTVDEQNLLGGACQVQVEEPVDAEGEDMEVSVEVTRANITWA